MYVVLVYVMWLLERRSKRGLGSGYLAKPDPGRRMLRAFRPEVSVRGESCVRGWAPSYILPPRSLAISE